MAAGALVLDGISKRFGAVPVLHGVSLALEPGRFITLLGPSGCGKTTLLRIVAGLEAADAGRVLLDGIDLTGLPAQRRPVNTVFQQYALFPHLRVRDNVAFGLRARGIAEAEVRRRVDDALALLRLVDLADRRPDQLSGGQKQRTALARALVNEPAALLLDEPLSALDAQLRAEVQIELRRLQRRLGTTFLLVTHDQDEAMTVSDRVVVMAGGRIAQEGAPQELYDRPADRFVAGFLGSANLIPGRREGDVVATRIGLLRPATRPPWDEGTLAIRPERIAVASGGGPNTVAVQVGERIFRGDHVDLLCEPGGLRVRLPPAQAPEPGAALVLHLPPEHLVPLRD